MKNKFKKTKEWIKNHQEGLTISAIVGSTFAVTVATTVVAIKQQAQYQRELEEAISSGKTILPNPDGSVWILDLKGLEKAEVL